MLPVLTPQKYLPLLFLPALPDQPVRRGLPVLVARPVLLEVTVPMVVQDQLDQLDLLVAPALLDPLVAMVQMVAQALVGLLVVQDQLGLLVQRDLLAHR